MFIDGKAWLMFIVFFALWRGGWFRPTRRVPPDGRTLRAEYLPAGLWFFGVGGKLFALGAGWTKAGALSDIVLLWGAVRLAPDFSNDPFAGLARALLGAAGTTAVLAVLVDAPALYLLPEPLLPWAATALFTALLGRDAAEAWALSTVVWLITKGAVHGLHAVYAEAVDLPVFPSGIAEGSRFLFFIWATVGWRTTLVELERLCSGIWRRLARRRLKQRRTMRHRFRRRRRARPAKTQDVEPTPTVAPMMDISRTERKR